MIWQALEPLKHNNITERCVLIPISQPYLGVNDQSSCDDVKMEDVINLAASRILGFSRPQDITHILIDFASFQSAFRSITTVKLSERVLSSEQEVCLKLTTLREAGERQFMEGALRDKFRLDRFCP